MTPSRVAVFIGAHSQDEAWTQRLVTQLAVYRDRLDLWDERRLASAPDAGAALADALGQASAAVLLLSPAWLTSRFATGGELERALHVPDAADGFVLPVRVEACDPAGIDWLARLSLRPPERASVSASARRVAVEAALRDVARECGTRLRAAAWSRPAPSLGTRSEALETRVPAFEPDRPAVFISYCHVDEEWKDRLVKHMTVFGGALATWDDRQIAIGQEWRAEIERSLTTVSAAVLLVSVDFLTSRFILGEEVPTLLRRRQSEGLRIFPVIVGSCAWEEVSWLASLQVRPRDGRPLELHTKPESNAALAAIAKEIGTLLRQVPAAPERPPDVPRVERSRPEPQSTAASWPLVELLPERGPDSPPATSWRPTLPGVAVRAFSFDTVRLDERGAIVQRRTLQAYEVSEDLGGGVSLELAVIPGGEFLMGSPDTEPGRSGAEGPQHRVSVEPFFLGKLAVTQAQWRAVAALPRVVADLNPDPAQFKGKHRPVECVSWHDAVEFCARVARKTSRAYRLPSEAEWECAARAGTTGPFAFGDTITPEVVNHDGNHPYGSAAKGPYRQATVEVGALGVANAWGLFDMHGNVWEWTLDPWHANYEGAPTDASPWTSGGDGTRRVARGGSWFSVAGTCRSAYRVHREQGYKSNHIGFRVLCVLSRTP